LSTARGTWKAVERRVATFFKTKRAYGSGSGGRPDISKSDTTHPTLYIEAKLRETHAARTLHDDVREKAKKEGKTPVLVMADKSRPGFLVCVHCDDLAEFMRIMNEQGFIEDDDNEATARAERITPSRERIRELAKRFAALPPREDLD